MLYYVPDDDAWTEASDPPADAPYLEIDDAASLQFVGEADSFRLAGAPARTADETVHTIAILSSSLNEGLELCALRAEGQDLTVEDRRPPEARTHYADAFEQLQSALDEILVPVYIDDALEEVSESVDGLVVVHTAQYEEPPTDECSYFRASAFQSGNHLFETERGGL